MIVNIWRLFDVLEELIKGLVIGFGLGLLPGVYYRVQGGALQGGIIPSDFLGFILAYFNAKEIFIFKNNITVVLRNFVKEIVHL